MSVNIQSFGTKQGVVKNQEVYWIHRILAVFYALACIFIAVGLISTFDLMNSVLVFLVVLLPLGGSVIYIGLHRLNRCRGQSEGVG